MLFRRILPLLILASVTHGYAGPVLSRPALMEAAQESATDNIGSGWCGRGIYSILNSLGLGAHLQPGNGQEWEKILMQAGWKPVHCLTPQLAPLGSVLVYNSDTRLGKVPRGTPGGYYGHVEMVALAHDGSRLYVSDCPRPKPGGSVLNNFTGRAWVPPGQLLPKAPPVDEQVADVLQERVAMAMAHFKETQEKQGFWPRRSTTR